MSAEINIIIWHTIFLIKYMIKMWYEIDESQSPLLATAIHHGHEVRDDVARWLEINEYDRLREEDPCTGFFTDVSGNRIIIDTSRFETDLNRPPENAIYRTPEQSWGLKVWKDNVPPKVWAQSLQEYDEFYKLFDQIASRFIEAWGYFILFDIHSYNYRRKEPVAGQNPEINVRTGQMNRLIWAPVVNHFKTRLREYNYFGRSLNVEENVKFKGGNLSNWVHSRYPDRSCVLSIEFKKIFMDEWTGAVNIPQIKELKNALKSTVPEVIKKARLTKLKLIQKQRKKNLRKVKNSAINTSKDNSQK